MKRDTMKKLKAWARSFSRRKGSGLQRLNNSSLNSGGSSGNSNGAVRLRPSESAKSESCSKRSTAMSDVRFVDK